MQALLAAGADKGRRTQDYLPMLKVVLHALVFSLHFPRRRMSSSAFEVLPGRLIAIVPVSRAGLNDGPNDRGRVPRTRATSATRSFASG